MHLWCTYNRQARSQPLLTSYFHLFNTCTLMGLHQNTSTAEGPSTSSAVDHCEFLMAKDALHIKGTSLLSKYEFIPRSFCHRHGGYIRLSFCYVDGILSIILLYYTISHSPCSRLYNTSSQKLFMIGSFSLNHSRSRSTRVTMYSYGSGRY